MGKALLRPAELCPELSQVFRECIAERAFGRRFHSQKIACCSLWLYLF